MKTQGILSALQTTMGGLSTQMKRLKAISENIANADKTPDAKGRLYQRQVVVPVSKSNIHKNQFAAELKLRLNRSDKNHFEPISRSGLKDDKQEYKTVKQDKEIMVYEPNNPAANKDGYVRKPDINVVEEMVDMISTSRMYEANVTVMTAAKTMAKKSLEI